MQRVFSERVFNTRACFVVRNLFSCCVVFLQGFGVPLVRKFAHSILLCLDLLFRNRLIHCDLKPENVLLKQAGRSGIKVTKADDDDVALFCQPGSKCAFHAFLFAIE